MQFRITARWPSPPLAPLVETFTTAIAAAAACNALERVAAEVSRIEVLEADGERLISRQELRVLAAEERTARPGPRNTIISILFGIVAAALPNSFGDFGTLPEAALLLNARISRARPRHRKGRYVGRAQGRQFEISID